MEKNKEFTKVTKNNDILNIELDDLEDLPLKTENIQPVRKYAPVTNHNNNYVKPGSEANVRRSQNSYFNAIVGHKTLIGLVAGLLAFFVGELISPVYNSKDFLTMLLEVALWTAGLSAAMGLALSATEDIIERLLERAFKNGLLGLLIGFVGGFIGGLIAQMVYTQLGGGLNQSGFAMQVLVRSLAWTLVGLFVGLAQGIIGRSQRKLINGVIGGLIGGFIGGLAFDFIGMFIKSGNGNVARFFGITAMGCCIGAAIGMVEEARKEAWLRVIKGAQMGKQFILYNNITRIGSTGKCEIVLIKDLSVMSEHCRIVEKNRAYFLEIPHGAMVYIDGTLKTGRILLKKGMILGIGQSQIVYEDKLL